MPKRRIFISCSYTDQDQAKGFNLMRHSSHTDVDFVGRHLLDPVDSTNEEYISRQVRDQMNDTSVTVVLLGEDTYESEWVQWEIEKSAERGNGVLAIRLKDQDAPLPLDCPVREALDEVGAEVIDWNPDEFNDAIERAFEQANRAKEIRSGPVPTGSSCGR
jgi:hypothetical protein